MLGSIDKRYKYSEATNKNIPANKTRSFAYLKVPIKERLSQPWVIERYYNDSLLSQLEIYLLNKKYPSSFKSSVLLNIVKISTLGCFYKCFAKFEDNHLTISLIQGMNRFIYAVLLLISLIVALTTVKLF